MHALGSWLVRVRIRLRTEATNTNLEATLERFKYAYELLRIEEIEVLSFFDFIYVCLLLELSFDCTVSLMNCLITEGVFYRDARVYPISNVL